MHAPLSGGFLLYLLLSRVRSYYQQWRSREIEEKRPMLTPLGQNSSGGRERVKAQRVGELRVVP